MLTGIYLRNIGVTAMLDSILGTPHNIGNVRFEFWSEAGEVICRLGISDIVPASDLNSSAWVFKGDTGSETVTGLVSPGGVVTSFKLYNVFLPNPDSFIIGIVGDLQSVGVDMRFNTTLWNDGAVVTIQQLKLDLMSNSISGNT